MVYNVEKTLKEHRSKISDADAKAVETALEETKQALKDGGTERLNASVDKLTTASHKLAEAMYSAAGAPGGGETPGDGKPAGESKPKDNVVDAEFVDMDDKNKK